jgi:hypothetical protein
MPTCRGLEFGGQKINPELELLILAVRKAKTFDLLLDRRMGLLDVKSSYKYSYIIRNHNICKLNESG